RTPPGKAATPWSWHRPPRRPTPTSSLTPTAGVSTPAHASFTARPDQFLTTNRERRNDRLKSSGNSEHGRADDRCALAGGRGAGPDGARSGLPGRGGRRAAARPARALGRAACGGAGADGPVRAAGPGPESAATPALSGAAALRRRGRPALPGDRSGRREAAGRRARDGGAVGRP